MMPGVEGLSECTRGPSFQERIRVLSEKKLKLVTGSSYIPKNNYIRPLGEDAHFIYPEKQTLGVADGVGRWARKGVDAGEYARKLMYNCALAISDTPAGAINPKHALSEAFSNTNIEGSSTACVITLNDNELHAANIGDSGFVVIRKGKVVFRSSVQQWAFNYPYQLGKTKDCPSLALEFSVGVEYGDVIVVGTDGLFDNVFDSDIESLVNIGLEKFYNPEVLACSIANFALSKSKDKTVSSPFESAAKKAGGKHVGGKNDDITVIVGYIDRDYNQESMGECAPSLVRDPNTESAPSLEVAFWVAPSFWNYFIVVL